MRRGRGEERGEKGREKEKGKMDRRKRGKKECTTYKE